MMGQATFSVDPETHRVFFITDDVTSSNINQVIANLDRPKPQVLIKVVFLEVTHSDDLDFGVEGSYSHSFFPSTITNSILASSFGLTNLGITGQQIGGTTMPPGAGIYSIIGSDFTATVRAIASASKVDVLSRPSILVRNNQPATITVGQSVPLVTGVTVNALTGSPLSTISYQNVGIILQVTPFITTDGLVEMIVAPQISSLSSQQVQVSTNVFAPVIDLRSASTVVVTPDGETVIIGGLMQNSKTTVDSKIPILGDIPLLGALFKHKQKDNTKTELLIFLTPHVVSMPSELASASAKEAEKTELAPKAFSEQELDKYFDKLPLKLPAKSGNH
jgi:general secretion pathway protein D